MKRVKLADAVVKAALRDWPQHPPGTKINPEDPNIWLRGRPTHDQDSSHPFLKLPGSDKLRTLPDGLWLKFGGTCVDPFVDILAVEACMTISNLLDKRSRFAPSTHSTLAVCPTPWLLMPVKTGDPTPRWKATRLLRKEPTRPFVVPVRDRRVLYALPHRHYERFKQHQLAHPHEYFMPMETLVAFDSDKDPEVCAMLAHATAAANFITERELRR